MIYIGALRSPRHQAGQRRQGRRASTTARATTRPASPPFWRSPKRFVASGRRPARSIYFHRDDRRRVGPARLGIFRDASDDGDRQGGREHQHRRVERLRTRRRSSCCSASNDRTCGSRWTTRSSGGDGSSVRMSIRSAATSIAPIISRSRRSACPRCRSRWRTCRRSAARMRNAHASWRRRTTKPAITRRAMNFPPNWDLSGRRAGSAAARRPRMARGRDEADAALQADGAVRPPARANLFALAG